MSLDPVRRETRHAIKQFSDTQQRVREIDEKIKQIEEGDGHRTPRIRASTRNHPRTVQSTGALRCGIVTNSALGVFWGFERSGDCCEGVPVHWPL